MEYLYILIWAALYVLTVNTSTVPNGPTTETSQDVTWFRTSKQKLTELKALFNSLDTNHDGKLSRGEMKGKENILPAKCFAGGEHQATDAEVDHCIKEFDHDRDGQLDFYEFLLTRIDICREDQYAIIFRKYDTDRDGFLSKADLGTALHMNNPTITQPVLDATFAAVDSGRHNKITCAEFVQAFYTEARAATQLKRYQHFTTPCEKLKGLLITFYTLDTDTDEKITREEINAWLTNRSQPIMSETFWKSCDIDRDGMLDPDEFLLSCPDEVLQEDRLKILFSKFNLSGGEYLTKDDIRKVLERNGEDASQEAVDETFAKYDIDGDGLVSWHDFYSGSLAIEEADKKRQAEEQQLAKEGQAQK